MLLLAAIFGGWEIVLMIFVVILFGAKNHFRKGVGEVTRDLDDAAHDAGESLGGVYGKSTAQALTPDNQTAEIYDPAVFHNPRAMKWMWFRAARQPASETRGVERHPIPYLDVAVKEAEPILAAVRQLMKNPPPGIAYDISKMMENDTSPNLVFVRVGAQALQTAACPDLHNHNLAGAVENLRAIEGFTRLGKHDPGLVCLMSRVTVLGIAIDVLWEALQAEGWNEQQLADMQELWQQPQDLLAQLPRAMEAERLMHLKNIEWFRSHTYDRVLAREREIFTSFGIEEKEIVRASGSRAWRQWVFHPLWGFAWADQEKVQYLKDNQKEMTAARQVVQHGSLLRLESDLARNRESYRSPFGSWRFYRRLPLREDFPGPDWHSLGAEEYPYTDYHRAWSVTLQNLTLNEMALTAIAIKRYELRHLKAPSALSELTPEIMAAAPRDFMDGKPLRYLRPAQGRFILYSIGRDFHDDGGDTALVKNENNGQIASPWAGKDWLWP